MSNIEALIVRVSPLVEPLHDAFGYACHRLEEMGISTSEEKRWLRTAFLRSEVFDYLSGQGIDGWLLDQKRHNQNGAIHIAHVDGDLATRVLREAPMPGGVPCAGSNGLRRNFFRNQPQFPRQHALWGEPKEVGHNLLTLWDERADEVSLRVVRPIGPGSSLRGVPIDLSVDLPRTRTDFESAKFEIYDEDLDEDTASYEEDEESDGSP